ncbi:methyltransferase domain-containing protein [Microterricola viridarii]|uniref:2-polyprenyl-3-methyl-5-hydroxy-6-metoxy-1,4-benzoquinol methylase n=1 Tax=Microterricola viridarii TaxID=412690 RepID=A0A1H1XZC8_9MICO|nr:methyltransferase domain-containing protein [Microterricola viridarii]SDT14475.1 2-polyprenyl-3-methyl-5-hydroxy-6-metoxy-1,4-benzoquinol methylase [Microterricola viridarii]
MTRWGWPLRSRATDATELMDAADADPETLARTYEQFRLVNAAVSGWRDIYRRFVRPHLSATRDTTLLDIGAGGGDLPLSLAHWATNDGLRLQITAIDPDARADEFARRQLVLRHPARLQPGVGGVEFRRAFSSELVAEGAQFDLVISNHMLHHLTPAELGGLLFDSERLVRPASDPTSPGNAVGPNGRRLPRALHSDITRSALAYAGFALGTLPFARNLLNRSYIRADGLTSIRRSYRPAELQAALPPGWSVLPQSHFRYLLTWAGPDV